MIVQNTQLGAIVVRYSGDVYGRSRLGAAARIGTMTFRRK
jgi:hypothetical protein